MDNGCLSSSLVAGGAAGCISKTCVAPLSRLVALKQVQAMPGSELYTGNFRSTRLVALDIYREEGVRAFWRGNCSTLLHRCCTSGFTFFTVAAFNRMMPRERLVGLEAFGRTLLTSSVGAFFGIVIAHPLDVVKTRLLTERGDQLSRYYGNTSSAFLRILKDEGLRGFYRGLGLSLTCTVPTIALNFTFFSTLRPHFCERDHNCSSTRVAVCGGLSAACASSILFPLDLLKKQMQLVGRHGGEEVYGSWVDASRTVYRKSGWSGFYRGLPLEIAKVFPGGAILFVANESFLSWLA